jgi:threonine aldolase
MRQAGILAACGIVALEKMVARLAEDHARARRLAEAFAHMPGIKALPAPTNIVIIETVAPAPQWQERLEAEGVRCYSIGPHRVRFVTHNDVGDAEVAHTIDRVAALADGMAQPEAR